MMENNSEDPSMEHELKRCLAPKYKLAIIEFTERGTVYSCVECKAAYTEKEKLEAHLCSHFKEYRYLCGICGTGLKRKEHLDRHTLGHQEVRPHVCDECGKGFKRKEHLNIHRSIHSGDKSHMCGLCHRSFYRKDHLQKHLQTHSKMFVETSQSVVAAEFVDIQDIKEEAYYDNDQEETYYDDSQPVEDMNCEASMEVDGEYSFENSTELRENSNELRENSSELGENSNELRENFTELKENSTELKENSTELIENSAELRENTTEFVPPKDPTRPFECCICHKTYKRKDHLKLHSLTHMKKDKICSECGKAFHREEQLLVHMHSHWQAYRAPPDAAGIKEEEATIGIDSDHLEGIQILPLDDASLLIPRVHYGNPSPDSSAATSKADNRPHECHICHRRFKRKQHLKVHANVHQKPLPTIWCSLCNEGFHKNDQFERHQCPGHAVEADAVMGRPEVARKENHPQFGLKIEPAEKSYSETIMSVAEERDIPTPQRVYVCKFCHKPFKRKDHYRIHLHIHTGVKSFFCPHCGKGFYRKDHLQKHAQVHVKGKPFTAPSPSPHSHPSPSPATPPPIPTPTPVRHKKQLPDLFPINMMKKEVRPEITITAPSNSALRVPLQIKVPYQVIMAMDNGEQRAVTIDPTANTHLTVT